MSKILVKEKNNLKVCELPDFVTLGESAKIKDVPELKELITIPCSEGEYQLVDDNYIFFKEGEHYFVYNMQNNCKNIIDIPNIEKNKYVLNKVSDIFIIFEIEKYVKIRAYIVNSDFEVKMIEPKQGESVEYLEFNGRVLIRECVGINIVGAYDIEMDEYIPTYPGNILIFDDRSKYICEVDEKEKYIKIYFYDECGINNISTRRSRTFLSFGISGDVEYIKETDGDDNFSFFDLENNVYFIAKKGHTLKFISSGGVTFVTEIDTNNNVYRVYDISSGRFLKNTVQNSCFEIVEINGPDEGMLFVEKELESNKFVSIFYSLDAPEDQIVAGDNNWLTYKIKSDHIIIKDKCGIIKRKIFF